MIPTFTQVFATARKAYIADSEIDAGQWATDTKLLLLGQSAYNVLVKSMANAKSTKLKRYRYWNLPANYAYLDPATVGIADMDLPIHLWDRTPRNSMAVQSAVPVAGDAPALQITFGSAHPFTTGQFACATKLANVSDDANNEWVVSVVNSTTINLNGCTAVAQGSPAAGGYIIDSNEAWPANPLDRLWGVESISNAAPNTSGGNLSSWAWLNDRFHFRGSSDQRQLRIQYRVSSTPPSDLSAPLGIDGCLEFLACYTAALWVRSRGLATAAESMFSLAVGDPSGEPGNGQRGYLGQFTREEVSSQQFARVQIRRYRPARNRGPVVRY